MGFLAIFLLVYSGLALFYLWYRNIFLLVGDQEYDKYSTSMSVVIPYFNEKPELIVQTVESVHNAKGNKEIIVVDDGSTDISAYERLKILNQTIPFKLIRYEDNRGKRHAHYEGFKECTGEIIVTIDSDTILDKNALIEIIKPFKDKEVGAVTGRLEILNKNKNLLTKMIASRYYNAFEMERKSQSNVNAIVCCTGALSSYRKSVIDKVKDAYISQTFLGKKCTYGDDRHLTMLVVKEGKKIKYASESFAYTEAMETFSRFIKQQIRWKKSWMRENLLAVPLFRKNKGIAFEIIITTLTTLMSLVARIGLIFLVITEPMYIPYAIGMILVMAFFHSLYLLFHRTEYFGYAMLYAFLHFGVIYWLMFPAMFGLMNTKWGTR